MPRKIWAWCPTTISAPASIAALANGRSYIGEEILGDRWLWENAFFDTLRETPHGPVADRPYASFSRNRVGYDRPEPGLGEHSFEVLADWGIDAARTQRLTDDGVVMRLC